MILPRLSQDHVEKYFKDHKCELLDTYISAHKKLKYKCKCGRISTISWNNFRKGRRCMDCGGRKKHTLEFIKEQFTKYNCELLSTEYINNEQKLDYICSCGRKSVIDYAHFANIHHCKECSREIFARTNSGNKSPMWNENREEIARNKRYREICYRLINRTLKNFHKEKCEKTYIMLGYNPTDLIYHIENHPNWVNCKNKKWHIDHIFPIKAFMDYSVFDIKIINGLDNLQPLLSCENLRKNDYYDKKEFLLFLNLKEIEINE